MAEPEIAYRWRPIQLPERPHHLAGPGLPALIAWWRRVEAPARGRGPSPVDRRAAAALGVKVELLDKLRASVIDVESLQKVHLQATQGQRSVRAILPDGSARYVDLPYGKFKDRSNNPLRPDGKVHQYCPPEQVAAEMARLVELYAILPTERPTVQAAWLHHALTQIHPFVDGNGRVARLVANVPLLRAGLPPIALGPEDREDRYLPALQAADYGDLRPFVAWIEDRVQAAALDLLTVAAPGPTSIDAAGLQALVAERQALRAAEPQLTSREAQDLAQLGGSLLRAQLLPFAGPEGLRYAAGPVAPGPAKVATAAALAARGLAVDVHGPLATFEAHLEGPFPGTLTLTVFSPGPVAFGALRADLAVALAGDPLGALTRGQAPSFVAPPGEAPDDRAQRFRAWLGASWGALARAWISVF